MLSPGEGRGQQLGGSGGLLGSAGAESNYSKVLDVKC